MLQSYKLGTATDLYKLGTTTDLFKQIIQNLMNLDIQKIYGSM